jgi:glycosyltransferase involved in cell wall biosynthesis
MRNADVGCHVSACGNGETVNAIRDPQSAIRNRTASRRLRVLHVINSFEYGGAEAMLCNILLRADRTRFEPSVVALIDDLTVAGPVLRAGIPVATMGMRPGVPDPRGVARLARHVRRARPDVVQCWMDHSNLIGGLAARLASRAPVVWGVHHSDHVAGVTKRSTLLTVAACAALSHHLPARVVCCSEHGRRLYEKSGFAAGKLTVIPNGFDVERFRPDPASRADVRSELGLADETPLVGLVARYDPLKDHATFLEAAAVLARSRPDAHFVLCGSKVDPANADLTTRTNSLGISDRCHLLGPRRDVARIFAALDVAASSSVSEAFPLAVGEAMACGVPCVATDVGDCALMTGDTGRIVPPRDPAAMAAAWGQILAMAPAARRALGLAARQRVVERFELGAVTKRYEDLCEQLAAAAEPDHRSRPSRPCAPGERNVYGQPSCAVS